VTLAQSVAHREPTAAMSQGPDSLLQSHFFVFNPSSTRRRMASGRDRSGSFCFVIHASKDAIRPSSIRTPIVVPVPVVTGRPLDFALALIDFAMI
jgi:hypothetical protein